MKISMVGHVNDMKEIEKTNIQDFLTGYCGETEKQEAAIVTRVITTEVNDFDLLAYELARYLNTIDNKKYKFSDIYESIIESYRYHLRNPNNPNNLSFAIHFTDIHPEDNRWMNICIHITYKSPNVTDKTTIESHDYKNISFVSEIHSSRIEEIINTHGCFDKNVLFKVLLQNISAEKCYEKPLLNEESHYQRIMTLANKIFAYIDMLEAEKQELVPKTFNMVTDFGNIKITVKFTMP